MAKRKSHEVRVGDTVIWYPQGKVRWNTGEPFIVRQLYVGGGRRDQVQLSRVIGPCEHIDNVWHASCGEDENLVSVDTRIQSGLWQTQNEHHELYLAELDRIEGGKERQREAAVAAEESAANRKAAVSAVRAGEDVNEVAERFGLDPHELAVNVEMGL